MQEQSLFLPVSVLCFLYGYTDMHKARRVLGLDSSSALLFCMLSCWDTQRLC